jgi:hypothetical protein
VVPQRRVEVKPDTQVDAHKEQDGSPERRVAKRFGLLRWLFHKQALILEVALETSRSALAGLQKISRLRIARIQA